MRIQMSAAQIERMRAETLARGWPWFPDSQKNFDLSLFGIAGESHEANLYDDAIGVVWRDRHGIPTGLLYRATVDPGRKWLLNPMRETGCAILARPRFYKGLWKRGVHKGHDALVQVGPCSIWRDNDRDTVLDMDAPPIDRPPIGINLHDPFSLDPAVVEGASAGCQVPWRKAYVAEIHWLVGQQAKAGQGETVSYALHDSRETESLRSIVALVAGS
jgi:hypothetical protein